MAWLERFLVLLSLYWQSTALQPTLVVGATGRVGRRVVQKLLVEDKPVRALCRDPAKAAAIFGTATSLEYPNLEVIQADLGRYDEYEEVLDKAVNGCDCIISVMGVVRFAKLTDFLPWRLFRADVSSWADRDHPYYGNYLGQKKLIELAEKHRVQRFVRLTGLGLAYSAFNPFSILFNTLLSLNNRYGTLCEQVLAKSSVPYVILRPGGLAEDARDTSTTNVQIDASGKLPFPGRIGRDDVADLCVEACQVLPPGKSYTLACRWCGDGVKPKPQGTKSDGYRSAAESLQQLVVRGDTSPPPASGLKPYSVAVAMVMYPLLYLVAKALFGLFRLGGKLLHG